MLKALRQSESLFSRYYLNEEFNDIMFNFELRDDIVIGEPFRYIINFYKVCSGKLRNDGEFFKTRIKPENDFKRHLM